MMGQEEKSERTKAREAFFLEFAGVIRKEFPDVPLMVTGGFTTRLGMENAVAGGDCDMVGLGRPAVLNPAIPNNIVFNPEIKDQDAVVYRKKNEMPWIIKYFGLGAVGAGIDTVSCAPLALPKSTLTFFARNGIQESCGSSQRCKYMVKGGGG